MKMSESNPPALVRLSEELGPLPDTEYGLCYFDEGGCHPAYEGGGFTSNQMRAYATAAVAAERERCARLLEDQQYMTLEPLRSYTADEVVQRVRSSVKHLAATIRRA
jgi:hypothetical protein